MAKKQLEGLFFPVSSGPKLEGWCQRIVAEKSRVLSLHHKAYFGYKFLCKGKLQDGNIKLYSSCENTGTRMHTCTHTQRWKGTDHFPASYRPFPPPHPKLYAVAPSLPDFCTPRIFNIICTFCVIKDSKRLFKFLNDNNFLMRWIFL